MKKEFSFFYDGKHYLLSAENSTYELEKGISVQVISNSYTEYNKMAIFYLR